MQINRVWEMPNSKTFEIKVIREFILDNIKGENLLVLDPFANEHSIKQYMSNQKYICNDLDPQYDCDYNMDALDFLKMFNDRSVDIVLFDPPYSGRQVSECYKALDKTVTIQDTSCGWWGIFKKEIARIVKPNGVVFSFGWNSNGMGLQNNFEIEKILLVAHGSAHNDTICTMEKKKMDIFDFI